MGAARTRRRRDPANVTALVTRAVVSGWGVVRAATSEWGVTRELPSALHGVGNRPHSVHPLGRDDRSRNCGSVHERKSEVGEGGPSRGWVWPPRELATEAGWLGSGPPPPPTSSLDSHGRWSRRNRPAASGKLDRQRSRRGGAYPRAARTRPAAVLPSPRPAMRGVTAFITKPICRMVGFSPREAVTAATSSSTIAAISASLSCWGR